jgi:predicted nucleotidyltransferase
MKASSAHRLGHSDRHSTRRTINGMVQRIVERFDPERIILFGSHARGTANADSDVDLLVVMHYQGSSAKAQAAIRLALSEFPVAKDIVVATPEEFAWRSLVPGTIERPAAIEGEVMHARC